MRVLLDTCVPGNVVEPLDAAGHDVVWCGDWEEDPGDEEILAFAHREGRVLVTLDNDFGALAVLHGKPHSGILPLVNMSIGEQTAACRQVLSSHAAELGSGAIITAERDRLRVRISGRD
jgi:predicted nuclease of predicted toxin-antitoxin system